MCCDPFEDLDDSLFHDLESEEVSEETLDMTYPLEEKKEKSYALIINPPMMKSKWRGLSIKIKKNHDKAPHIEALLSLILLDKGKVVQPCLPPNVEEVITIDDEEFEGPVEKVHASTPPTYKDENMVILIHIDGLVKVPFDMVDEPIDTFIQIGRCKWDISYLKFDRDHIYEIEGNSQEEGVSSSVECSSYIYDVDIWLPGDDMVKYLFHPFEYDLSQHTQSDLKSSFGTYTFKDEDFFMKTSNHCAHILMTIRTWLSQSSQRFILQRGSIFILDISMGIHRGRGSVFLHLRLFITSYPLLQETMQYSSDLTFPLSP
jgi:hypothetical protein